ncbi:hypothetical protein IMCC12053_2397 [Celeribacter marinus]|uniref:Uncharacterized protein n=1 Tax=Celeribacter marinus TaxID=1397108 RepID=A0A0N9ZL14_9RHOB|nr:hypothetical protein IMCC12053_2397 [Celeribacter marinus]
MDTAWICSRRFEMFDMSKTKGAPVGFGAPFVRNVQVVTTVCLPL